MKITILTTEKKLTRGIIKQMQVRLSHRLEAKECLGFLYNVHPEYKKLFLFCINDSYCLVPWDVCTTSNPNILETQFRRNYITRKMKFSDVKARNAWMDKHKALKSFAKQIFI